jgi:hypothetical protein
VVLAIFQNEASADSPAADLKESGVAQGDAIGVLALNEQGELKTDKVGKRSMGKGANWRDRRLRDSGRTRRGASARRSAWLSAPQDLGLDKADRARLGSELEGGKAAVGVLVPLSDASFMADKLASMGGTPETHQVSVEAVEEATKAAPPTE